jgi:hypothetical protein
MTIVGMRRPRMAAPLVADLVADSVVDLVVVSVEGPLPASPVIGTVQVAAP